jgi:hypothetical protein
MRRTALAALVTVLLGGCALSTTETIYTPTLIYDIAVGSNALERVASLLDPNTIAAAKASNPQATRASDLLFRGQLDKLSESDMRSIQTAEQGSQRLLDAFVTKLRSIALDLARSRLKPATTSGLSTGAVQFAGLWNRYLAANQDRVARVVDAVRLLRPAVGEINGLVASARATTRLRSTAAFERERVRVIKDVLHRGDQFKALAAPPLTQATDLDHRLASQIKSSPDARAIVVAVNKAAPRGFLAKRL